MKNTNTKHLIVAFLVAFAAMFISEKADNGTLVEDVELLASDLTAKIVPVEEVKTCVTNITGTYYNAEASQCDSDPLITADGSKIDLNLLGSGKIRWVALSRNLLKRWGGKFDYGDKVMVEHEDKRLCGIWIVRDCMNARFIDRIDFLVSKGVNLGKNEGIKMIKI